MLRQSHVSEGKINTAKFRKINGTGPGLPSEFEQDSFHGVVTLPLSKAGQLGRINLDYELAIFHLASGLYSVYVPFHFVGQRMEC